MTIEAPVQDSQTKAASPADTGSVSTWHRAVAWIPPKARLAVLTGSFVLVAFFIHILWTSGASTLQIVCRHSFRAADISVRVDGNLAFSEHISGAAKKRLGLFEQVEGNFSKSLSLSSGSHLVEVHLRSADEGFDQTKSSRLSLPRGEETTLQISTSRSSMSLSYQGPAEESAGWWRLSDSAISALVTILGSVASAGVGFFVQEFLRSKKPA